MRQLKNFVNGQWIKPGTTEYLDVENPSTGEIIAQVPLSTASDTEIAITAAAEAFNSWS